MPYTVQGITHSWRYKSEWRNDKHGQVVRLQCRCGLTTNWHCEKWQAETAMYQLHEDQLKRGK